MIAQAKTHLRRLLPKSAFVRGVSVLVGGTAGAQLLTVLASPLLTRLYSPEDFGLLAVYGSLLALIGDISSLRYELAIPLPEDDVEAANVAALSLILVGLSTLLSGVLVWLLGSAIAEALGVPALADYLWLLPVGVLLGGAYNVFNYWSVRTKRFSTIASTRLRQALATGAIQLAAFKLGGIALLYAQVAGQSVGTTSLARPAIVSAGFRQVSWRGIAQAAGRYRRFPIFSTWAGFANTAGLQLPPMLFAALFGPVIVGLYALSHRVLTLPMSLVGGAIGQVFFANAADAHRVGQLAPLFIKVHARLSVIGLPAALMLISVGPDLFAIAFGEQWREAGEIARWMSPWLFFQFVSSPLSAAIFSATEKQQYMLAFQIVMLSLRLLAIGMGVIIGDFLATIKIFSIASSMSYVGLLHLLAWLSGAPIGKIIYSNLSSLLLSLIIASPVLVVILNPNLSLSYLYGASLCSFVLLFWWYWLAFRKEVR